MKEILQQWLENLGIFIDLYELGELMRDGIFLLNILQFYNVFLGKASENIGKIRPSDNLTVCINNLTQLSLWFKLLGLVFDFQTINSIAEGNTAASINFLYQLFICLEDRQSLNFVDAQFLRTINKTSEKFTVERVSEIESQEASKKIEQKYLSRLFEHEDVLAWYRNKLKSENMTKSGKLKYSNKKENKSLKGVKVVEKLRCVKTERNRYETSSQNIFTEQESGAYFSNHHYHISQTPVELLTRSKKEKQKELQNVKFRNYCEETMSNDLWEILLQKEEEDYKEIFSEKFLKQSRYEKRMSIKLFQLLHQDKVQRQNLNSDKEHMENLIQKKSESSTDLKDSLQDFFNHYSEEKKRTIELHRRLYAEKLKLRFKKHYALCSKALWDMIDLAVKWSEYENYYEIPLPKYLWEEWKSLFCNCQPIFDIVDSIEDLITQKCSDLYCSKEWARQNVMDYHNLKQYLLLKGEWDTDMFWPEREKYTDNQHIILGYIVHRLLDKKYPPPPKREPADLPRYPVTAILNNIDDELAIIKLRNLLSKPQIFVADVNSAVSYCFEALNYEYLSQKPVENASEIMCVQELSVKETDITDSGIFIDYIESRRFKDAEAQTSLSCVTESKGEPSHAARIGLEIFYNMLTEGELDNNLIVDALIELIKSQKIIKGWVIVNFPCNMCQASLLEYALTGKIFPFCFDAEALSSHDEGCSNSSKEIPMTRDQSSFHFQEERRNSWLVPNPRKYYEDDIFRTYFTLFISAVNHTPLYLESQKWRMRSEFEEKSCSLLLEHPEKDGVPTLSFFYEFQGITMDFIYESFDTSTLKRLARVILGMAPLGKNVLAIPSTELFGEGILRQLESTNPRLNMYAPRRESGETNISSEIVESHVVRESGSISDYLKSSSKSKIETVKPGEKGWVFTDFPIPYLFEISLASFWEGIQSLYINSMTAAFFLKRHCKLSVFPYMKFVNKTIQACLNRRDDRQDVVSTFLKEYNNIHQILRSDEDMIIELHCRVSELEEQLISRCEVKRAEAETMRQVLINQNWLAEQTLIMANVYISLLQSESNRFSSTLQLLQDYYLIMLKTDSQENIKPILLKKIDLKDEATLKEINQCKQLIAEMLNRGWYKDGALNPFFSLIEREAKQSTLAIESSRIFSENLVSKEELLMMRFLKDAKDKEIERRQMEKHKKQKATDVEGNLLIEEEFNEKENRLKNLFMEWLCVLKNETERSLFRIQLITKNAYNEIIELEKSIILAFNNLSAMANAEFREGCECIRKICRLFGTAIEEKTSIYGSIIFTGSIFHVIKNPVEAKAPALRLPPPLVEDEFYDVFTVNQLTQLVDRLLAVSPNGLIAKEVLASIINDNRHSLCLDLQKDHERMPLIWFMLKPTVLEKVLKLLFGNSSVSNWKDFVIYGLDLPFPLMEELIDTKLQFLSFDAEEHETVSKEHYQNITLWFHRELPECPRRALRNVLAKELLFNVFKVTTYNNNYINYASLLLAFCKDPDPKIGIGKALAYLMGRCVIVYEEDLYLEHVLSDHIASEIKIVQLIMDELLNSVVDVCNGFTEHGMSDFDIQTWSESRWTSHLHSEDVVDGIQPYYSEMLYNQFIRRLKMLQWTSLIPVIFLKKLLIDSDAASYYMIIGDRTHFLHYHFEQLFRDIDDSQLVFAPEFLKNILKYNYISRFRSFSLKETVDYIVKQVVSDISIN